MAPRVLARTVVLTDEAGTPRTYLAGEPVPDDIAEQITNPAAWEAPADQMPVDAVIDVNEATVDAVIDWTGGDAGKAKRALEAEQARDKGPRSTLIARLEEIAGFTG